jgi:hypothetical protein
MDKNVRIFWVTQSKMDAVELFGVEAAGFDESCKCAHRHPDTDTATHVWQKVGDHLGRNTAAFLKTCGSGLFETSIWYWTHTDVDVHAEHDHAFRFACARGHLKVAKWLLALGDVDIHARNDTAFLWACEGSHFEVAKWLLGVGQYLRILARKGDGAVEIVSEDCQECVDRGG